jgi:hypothetical protein
VVSRVISGMVSLEFTVLTLDSGPWKVDIRM